MMHVRDYRGSARRQEKVFRNILADLVVNRHERPLGQQIPPNLDSQSSIDSIFHKYSENELFSICDFKMVANNSAIIAFRYGLNDLAGGAELEYFVGKNGSVRYKRQILIYDSST
jgi:hypothetical protein